jgi:hypothetical protein
MVTDDDIIRHVRQSDALQPNVVFVVSPLDDDATCGAMFMVRNVPDDAADDLLSSLYSIHVLSLAAGEDVPTAAWYGRCLPTGDIVIVHRVSS